MNAPIPQPLIFWLCAYRLNLDSEGEFNMPSKVGQALLDHGLLEQLSSEGRTHNCRITDKGLALTDLHGPELGIDTIPTPQH